MITQDDINNVAAHTVSFKSTHNVHVYIFKCIYICEMDALSQNNRTMAKIRGRYDSYFLYYE